MSVALTEQASKIPEIVTQLKNNPEFLDTFAILQNVKDNIPSVSTIGADVDSKQRALRTLLSDVEKYHSAVSVSSNFKFYKCLHNIGPAGTRLKNLFVHFDDLEIIDRHHMIETKKAVDVIELSIGKVEKLKEIGDAMREADRESSRLSKLDDYRQVSLNLTKGVKTIEKVANLLISLEDIQILLENLEVVESETIVLESKLSLESKRELKGIRSFVKSIEALYVDIGVYLSFLLIGGSTFSNYESLFETSHFKSVHFDGKKMHDAISELKTLSANEKLESIEKSIQTLKSLNLTFDESVSSSEFLPNLDRLFDEFSPRRNREVFIPQSEELSLFPWMVASLGVFLTLFISTLIMRAYDKKMNDIAKMRR